MRKYGISFYEFNPREHCPLPPSILVIYFCAVGGGFFTGRYNSLDQGVEPGSRFDPTKGQGRVRPHFQPLSM